MTGLSSHKFKQSMKTRQGQNFKHSRHHYWNRVWSMKYEENKHKNECNRWSKVYKGGKHINQLKKGLFNVYVQWIKSSSLNYFCQIHYSNKFYCICYNKWIYKTWFFQILYHHVAYSSILFSPCRGQGCHSS